VIAASTDDLIMYIADLVETVERFGAVALPPSDGDEIVLEQDGSDLIFELATRLPVDRRSRDVDLVFAERWRPAGRETWELVEYAYELRHHELGYRRALHRHDEEQFVKHFDVATHEHCEKALGYPVCGHYFGEPVAGAIHGFHRLYGIWLTNQKPACSDLHCLD
jgi:hypothetical protein